MQHWLDSVEISAVRPRLAIPYVFLTAFVKRGHSVSAISYESDAVPGSNNVFSKIYGQSGLTVALKENDISLLWGGRGAVSTLMRVGRSSNSIMLGTYVWSLSYLPSLGRKVLGLMTRIAARFSRAAVFMTREQANQARRDLPAECEVLDLNMGVDTTFYRAKTDLSEIQPDLQQTMEKIIRKPYVVMLGDQQRCDDDLLELVQLSDLNFVRVCRNRETFENLARKVDEEGLTDRLYCFHDVDHLTARFILQNAVCYLGLVDSRWQPASWTVACESLASGTPVIIYDGIAVNELQQLGAGTEIVRVVDHGNVHQVAVEIEYFRSSIDVSLRQVCFDFSAQELDMEKTAPSFVKAVESMLQNGVSL
jgi:hypothetical protein